jgi:hypothetical protein
MNVIAPSNQKQQTNASIQGITTTCLYAENISNQFSGYAKIDAGIAAGLGTLGTLSPVGSLVAKYLPEVALVFGTSAGIETGISYAAGQIANANCPQ